MSIVELQAIAADAKAATAVAVGITDQQKLMGLIAAADAAYTAAVVAAVGGSGTWGDVQQAGIVAKQVKAGRVA